MQPKSFKIEDGHLQMTVTRDQLSGMVSSSSITTWPRKPRREKRLCKYGYFETRMWFELRGTKWPAFWLLAADRTTMDGGDGKGKWCEIDIFEGGRPDF